MEELQAEGKHTEQVGLRALRGGGTGEGEEGRVDWKEEGLEGGGGGREDISAGKLLRKQRQRSRNELAFFFLVPLNTLLTSSFQLPTLLLC